VGAEGERGATGAVIGHGPAAGLDDHGEDVAANAGRHGLDHAEDRIRGNRRIDGRPATVEHVEGGTGGDGMPGGNHAIRAADAGGGWRRSGVHGSDLRGAVRRAGGEPAGTPTGPRLSPSAPTLLFVSGTKL